MEKRSTLDDLNIVDMNDVQQGKYEGIDQRGTFLV